MSDDPPPPSPRRGSVVWGVTLLAVVLIGLLVRWPYLGHDGFWYDELLTAEFMTGRGDVARDLPSDTWLTPAPDSTDLDTAPAGWAVWAGLDGTVHPPLYYLAVRGWASGVGTGDVALRSWSTLCSLGGVLLLGHVVARTHGRVAGTLAALMMALAGPQIYFAHEARHYAQGVFLLLLAAAAGWGGGVADGRRRVSWRRATLAAAAVVAAGLTHYFTAGAALAVAAAGFAGVDRASRRRLAVTLGVGCVAATLAWGPFFVRQVQDGFATTSWIPLNDAPLADPLRHLAALPLAMLVHTDPLPSWLLALSWTLWIVPAARALAGRGEIGQRLAPWVLWFPLAVAPAAAVEVLGGREVMVYPRYTVFAAPALFALAAVGLRGLRSLKLRWAGWAVPVGVVLMAAVELTRPYLRPLPDFRPVGEVLARGAEPGDAVVIVRHPEVVWWHTGIYRSVSRYGMDGRVASLRIATSPTSDLDAAGFERVWVFTPGGVPAPTLPTHERARTEGFPPIGSATLWVRDETPEQDVSGP